MTSNQTSSIRFTVEESVWFKKGQEVSDLLAMSLDPEISVQEHDDYISIRGSLVLSGEYHPLVVEEDLDIFSLRDTSIYRTVDEVAVNESGTQSMKHRFPIDITIPTSRIRSLEDVYVLIEAFDYEIPERGRLELKADLCISGIVNEKESSMAARKQAAELEQMQERQPAINEDIIVEEQQALSGSSNDQEDNDNIEEKFAALRQSVFDTLNRTTVGQDKSEEDKFPSFQTEVRKDPNSVEEEDLEALNRNVIAEDGEGTAISNRAEDNLVAFEDEAFIDKEEYSGNHAVLANRLDVSEAEEEAEAEIEVPVNIVSNKVLSPNIGMKGRSELAEKGWNPKSLYSPQQTMYNTSGTREYVEEDETRAESPKRLKRSENALYLTKMLSAEGEEDFSKLRLRIVQSGETLGTIAESYDISANQIIRLNGLNDDVIKEGQILYIPEYAGVEK